MIPPLELSRVAELSVISDSPRVAQDHYFSWCSAIRHFSYLAVAV
jgi:hypothetical protein